MVFPSQFTMHPEKNRGFYGRASPQQVKPNLKTLLLPGATRKILIMVKAGAPVDAVIDQLKPLLEPGDIIIDGGNSFYEDTQRRGRD